MKIAIIGGGPAGLRAAEIASAGGAEVALFDAKPSVGRKFLVAGRGGLNLTKEEPWELFARRYSGPGIPAGFFDALIEECGPEQLRDWAGGLGVETFAASTGRVYPKGMKAAPLLRRWVERLRQQGVALFMRHRWSGLRREGGLVLRFDTPEGEVERGFHAVILALGGGSWPQTGSDGTWTNVFEELGIAISPLAPANSGWEVDWPEPLLLEAEGLPLKNIALSAGEERARGELMVTRYGLEGGALYQLGAVLRGQPSPVVSIDLKPEVSPERLKARLGPVRSDFLREAAARWKLSPAAVALLKAAGPYESPEEIAFKAKNLTIPLTRPRPIAEAISSAGGVVWSGLTPSLMVRDWPGLFVAGEMIDWEAPTGGYLIQGCFATGGHAARGALHYAATADHSMP